MMNTPEREPGSVDGLILGLIDVQASMALLLCQCSGLKPKKLAQVLLNIANSHQAAGGSPEYLAARRYAAESVAETLKGLGISRDGALIVEKPGLEVIMGGLTKDPE